MPKINDLLIKFYSGQISKKELEDLIREVVKKECDGKKVEKIIYGDDGVDLFLDDGEVVEIEIDWEEIKVDEDA